MLLYNSTYSTEIRRYYLEAEVILGRVTQRLGLASAYTSTISSCVLFYLPWGYPSITPFQLRKLL